LRSRYKYGLGGLVLGFVAVLAMALPVLFIGQLCLKADHTKGPVVSAVSWAVLAFFAGFPPFVGYSIGRKRELAAPPAEPAAASGGPSILQVILGIVIGAFSTVFAYVGGAGAMILAAFLVPQGFQRRFDSMPVLFHEFLFVVYIAMVVLAGWGGYRLGVSMGKR